MSEETVAPSVQLSKHTIDLGDLHVRRGEVILLTQHFGSLVGICNVRNERFYVMTVNNFRSESDNTRRYRCTSQTQSLITFYDRHHVTVGVNAADMFGMGRVDAPVEDQRCGNRVQQVHVSY